MSKATVIGQGPLGEQVTAALVEGGCHVLVHDEAGWVAKGGSSANSFSITDHIRMCDEVGIDIIFLCLPMRFRQVPEEREFEAVLDEISRVRQAKNRERVIVVVGNAIPFRSTAWDMRCAPWGCRVVLSPFFRRDFSVLGGHVTPVGRVSDLLGKLKFEEIRKITLPEAVEQALASRDAGVNSQVPL